MGAGSEGARGLHARHQSEQLGLHSNPREGWRGGGGGEETVEGRGGRERGERARASSVRGCES
jgi:hypothetical protein